MKAQLSKDDSNEIEARWRQAALSTESVDRVAAEAAVRTFYRRVGFLGSNPEILWCRSPAEFGAVAAARARSLGVVTQVVGRYATLPGESDVASADPVSESGLSRLFLHGTGPARTHVESTFNDPEYQMVEPPPENEDSDEYGSEADEAEEVDEGLPLFTRFDLAPLILTQFDWEGYAEAEKCVRTGSLSAQRPVVALVDLMRQVGAFLPLLRVALLCERPVRIELDSRGMPHSETAQALVYPDGWGGYAWWGCPLDERLWQDLVRSGGATPQAVFNIEDRQVQWELIERIGIETYARAIGPERVIASMGTDRDARVNQMKLIEGYGAVRLVLDSARTMSCSDDFGTLYSVDVPDGESVVVVRVLNSTPEPDGTFRDYFLRVPPSVKSAREAVAWTFDVEPDEYEPVCQT